MRHLTSSFIVTMEIFYFFFAADSYGIYRRYLTTPYPECEKGKKN